MSEELEFLLDQLTDESRPVHVLSLMPLSDLGRGLMPQFRTAWLAFSAARRLDLVNAMVEQAESNIHLNFHSVLRECLTDENAQVRRLAVEGLWEDERPNLVSLLKTLLASDSSPGVRAAAANSLGRFVLQGVLGEVADSVAVQAQNALRAGWDRPGETTEVRRRCLEGLAYLNDADIYDLIENAYYDEDELMRQSAVFAMGRTADRRWSKYVLTELSGAATAMRFEAAIAAGEFGLKAAVRPLIRLLDDPDAQVREAAIVALGKIGGPEAKRALETCLSGSDERMAEAAAEAMEELTFNSGTPIDPLLEYERETQQSGRNAYSDDEDDSDENEEDEEDLDFDQLRGEDYSDDLDRDSEEEDDEEWSSSEADFGQEAFGADDFDEEDFDEEDDGEDEEDDDEDWDEG